MEFTKLWLQWALNFISVDLSSLSRKEKHSLFREVVYFSSDSFFNTSWELIEKQIEFSHNKLIEWEGITSEIQKALKDFFNVMTTTRAAYRLPELSAFTRPEGLWPPSSKDHRVYFQLNFYPKDPTPKNWAIVNFAKLIQGIEMHVICKCEECGSYFLNFSLRKKVYCSPRCASKSLARTRKKRWGVKKYRAYLKVQKRLANETYKKKRAAIGKAIRHRAKKRGSRRIPKLM
jgi:hypothetical protein